MITGVRATGWLSFRLVVGVFFGTGMTVTNCRQDGMTAWARERLNILVKMRVRWWAHALSILPGTPSGPAAFLGFTARSTRLTSCPCTASGVVQGPGGGRVGVEQEPDGGGGRAEAGECCTDVSKREKKQFSSSASSTLRSPVVASQPLKFVIPYYQRFLKV